MSKRDSLLLALDVVKGQIDELDEHILNLTRKRAALILLVNFLEEFPEFNEECGNA